MTVNNFNAGHPRTSLTAVGRALAASFALCSLAACTSLGASGPSSGSVRKIEGQSYSGQDIALVDLNLESWRRISAFEQSRSFAMQLGTSAATEPLIGPGDVLDISLWEAPPAVLFGAGGEVAAAGMGAQNRTVLQQIVGVDGTLSIPFVGTVAVVGRSTGEIGQEIVRRLAGRANDPQAIVRLAQNASRNVTVLGDVAASRQVPLGPKGERLLDVLASTGGPRQPVGQTTVQVSRGTTSATMPLEAIIQDPVQNVRMLPDDVVTVMHQPYSFIALGAVARSSEIPFEGRGISLAQALARTGGLRDDRANIRGVFIFRLESPQALDLADMAGARQTGDGRIPVVYRLNLADASGFFVAQDFMIRDKDVLYVSTAPGADLQRFLSTVASLAFSAISIGNVLSDGSNSGPSQ